MNENTKKVENQDIGYNIIENSKEIKKTPFNKYNKRVRIQENFNKEKITIKRNGKFINAFDYTQSGREGTEIYATLDKYNKNLQMTKQTMETNAKKLYGDIGEIGDLQTIMNNAKKCERLWNNLDSNIKKEFDNNIDNFVNNAEEWTKNYIKKEFEKRKNKGDKE